MPAAQPLTLSVRRGARARAARIPVPAPELTVRVKRGGSLILLSGEPVARAAAEAHRREFLDRLFSISAVSSVQLDAVKGSVRLFLDARGFTAQEAIDALAAAMRLRNPPRLSLPQEELILNGASGSRIDVWRAEKGLTLWRLQELGPGKFRLTHPLLFHELVRERALDALACLADVTRQESAFLADGAIDVWCRPHRMTAEILREALDASLSDYAGLLPRNGQTISVRRALINANLILAPITDFLFAPLGIINAALVYILNIEHVPGAVRAVRERRCNLELLYLVIGAATFLSYDFFGAAVMYWMLDFWPRAVKHLRQEGTRQFLARYRRTPWRLWIERDGALLESATHGIPAGEILALRGGDTVPGDGVILEGEAEVSEAWITGAPGLSAKRSGDPLYASSVVGSGEVRVRIDTLGARTAAGLMASRYEQALLQPCAKEDAREFAEAWVLPALICGAAALGRGGLHMMKPVMRPDYFTGPAIAEELSQMMAVIQSAEAGLLIADSAALDRLAEAECWVFDDSVDWIPADCGALTFEQIVRDRGIEQLHYIGREDVTGTRQRAEDLGFTSVRRHFSEGEKQAFIARRQHMGQTVAYFGDCRSEPMVAAQANVAITVLDPRDLSGSTVPLALFQPGLGRCLALHTLSQARAQSVKSSLSAAVIPNLAAAAGAIILHFPVLTSVILTNLGTLATYYRWRDTLKGMTRAE